MTKHHQERFALHLVSGAAGVGAPAIGTSRCAVTEETEPNA